MEGDLAITELMIDPLYCADTECEYIEVYNSSGGSVDLNCLTIADVAEHVGYVEGTLEVPAGGYAVLTRRSDEAGYGISGVAQSDYRRGVSLNNDADTVTLSYGETVLDIVGYDTSGAGGWPGGTPGQAMVLRTVGEGAASDNNDAVNWCGSQDDLGTSGDFGSPGTANLGDCPIVIVD